MGPTTDKQSIAEWSPLVFRSDTFKSLYELIQLIPGFGTLLQSVIRIQLVIDANVVLAEIRWRLKRRNSAARSDLLEAIDSGIVIAIAPEHLLTEIDDEHLSRILDGTGKTVVDAKREWDDFRLRIHLYKPLSRGHASLHAVDSKDVPYAVTCDEIGADAIHTRDKHLLRMGAPVVRETPDRILRDCARFNAVVMGISVSSAFAVTVTYASFRGLWALIEKAFEGFCSLPAWAKILIAGGAIAVVTQPRFREGTAAKWGELCAFCQLAAPGILDGLAQIAVLYQEAEKKAVQTKAELQSILPPPTPKTALQYARVVCLRNQAPLPLDELLRRMKLDGYVSASRTERSDLRKLLSSSGQFVEKESGDWILPEVPIELPTARPATAPRRRLKPLAIPRRKLNSRRIMRRKSLGAALKVEA